jgi:tetratricopeptide (TPR) repeat protein
VRVRVAIRADDARGETKARSLSLLLPSQHRHAASRSSARQCGVLLLRSQQLRALRRTAVPPPSASCDADAKRARIVLLRGVGALRALHARRLTVCGHTWRQLQPMRSTAMALQPQHAPPSRACAAVARRTRTCAALPPPPPPPQKQQQQHAPPSRRAALLGAAAAAAAALSSCVVAGVLSPRAARAATLATGAAAAPLASAAALDGAAVAALAAAAEAAASARDFGAAEALYTSLLFGDASPGARPRWLEARAAARVDGKAFAAARRDYADALAELSGSSDAAATSASASASASALSAAARVRLLAGDALACEGLADWPAALARYDAALAAAADAAAAASSASAASFLDPYVLNSRGNVLGALGRWEEARAAYLARCVVRSSVSAKRNSTLTRVVFFACLFSFPSAALRLLLARARCRRPRAPKAPPTPAPTPRSRCLNPATSETPHPKQCACFENTPAAWTCAPQPRRWRGRPVTWQARKSRGITRATASPQAARVTEMRRGCAT